MLAVHLFGHIRYTIFTFIIARQINCIGANRKERPDLINVHRPERIIQIIYSPAVYEYRTFLRKNQIMYRWLSLLCGVNQIVMSLL